jgi:AraC family transcriptional regulator
MLLYRSREERFLAKIAVGTTPAVKRPTGRLLARGEGWNVSAMTCDAGPRDRSFEEQHPEFAIALVTGGSFQYRSTAGRELMIPGSILLGNPGQYFECGHEHGVGDRCISFGYKPDYFEGLIAESGVGRPQGGFGALRLAPIRQLSGVFARACALNAAQSTTEQWEEISVELAGTALELAAGIAKIQNTLPSAEARVTRVIRMLESHPHADYKLGFLAQEARLSRYHFLRVFQQLTGLTPHKYILRARLRRAATRLLVDPTQILDIALDCGFGDISNFNHAFRTEFGISPRKYRNNFLATR